MFKVNNFKSSILQSIRDKTVELVSILHSRLDDETGTGDVDMQVGNPYPPLQNKTPSFLPDDYFDYTLQ
jgi:hypothetical protein